MWTNTGLSLTIALNYGARNEILAAAAAYALAMKDKGFQREDHGRRKDDNAPDSGADKRANRKISEPLARAPKPAARKHGVKAAAAKNNKSRKSRR